MTFQRSGPERRAEALRGAWEARPLIFPILEEGWWSGEGIRRDYWDVELTTGGLYRLYRDPASGSWFADGVYD